MRPPRVLHKQLAFTGVVLGLLIARAGPAQAVCNFVNGSGVGSFQTGSTNNATQNTHNFDLGYIPAGTTIIVGTTGIYGAENGGTDTDTYLRLFSNGVEVAYNDDACGGQNGRWNASRIVYTVPKGWRNIQVRAGCYSSLGCNGLIMAFFRFDSNGYLSNVVNAYNSVTTTNSGSFYQSAPISNSSVPTPYTDCGSGCKVHFQGVQRLYDPYLGEPWFTVSGSNVADIFFFRRGLGGNVNVNSDGRTWKEAGYLESSTGAYISMGSFPEALTPWYPGEEGRHIGGVQLSGYYLLAGLQEHDESPTEEVGRVKLFNIAGSSPWQVWSRQQLASNNLSEPNQVYYFAASDAGITKHRDGTILMVAGTKGETDVLYYRIVADEYTSCLTTALTYTAHSSGGSACGSTVGKQVGWADIENVGSIEFRNIRTVEHFSNINLVTQANGATYVLKTDCEINWLGNCVQNRAKYARITDFSYLAIEPYSAYRNFHTSSNHDFDAAAGFFIDPLSDRLYLYSNSRYSNSDSSSSFRVFEWGSSLAAGLK